MLASQAFKDLAPKVTGWLATGQHEAELKGQVTELREGEKPLVPFHWEIEFPEVFSRETPGFDCFVGNPPFLGGRRISSTLGDEYRDWLVALHELSSSNADLVAHFFRRAFGLIRRLGTLGLIATNTIAQGDTRGTGLQWILKNSGVVYQATRRFRWPGMAAVIASTIHIEREPLRLHAPVLDGRDVPRISAFLFHQGGDDDPAALTANGKKCFQGSIPLGMGFTFDDTDPTASSLAEMDRLVANDPRNMERIFPYLGGEDFNTSPTQSHHRYVINFGEMTLAEATQWPDLLRILEKKVKPEREKKSKEVADWPWWQFWRVRNELRSALGGHKRFLVIPFVGKWHAPAFGAHLPDRLRRAREGFVIADLLDDSDAPGILALVVGIAWGRAHIPFFGVIRWLIPALAPFETKWLFSGKGKAVQTVQETPHDMATATIEEHEAFREHLHQKERPFRKPGLSLDQEFKL